MKKLFGVALLALPFLAASTHAAGWPFNIQAGGSWYIKGGPGPAWPQAGPWYLYWPLEAHFVAPAPTGYPYWPGPQVSPPVCYNVPLPPPPDAIPRRAVAQPLVQPVPAAPILPPPGAATPVPSMPPAAAAPTMPPAAPSFKPSTKPQLPVPPYLQPTSYYPIGTGQPPSYWYDR